MNVHLKQDKKNQIVNISGYRKDKIYNFEQFERFKTKNTKRF